MLALTSVAADRLAPCPAFDTFTMTPSAQLYSTFAGVLAGFAFFALIFLLPRINWKWASSLSPKDEFKTVSSHVSVSLVIAFMCMIVATFLYAVLSGEKGLGLTGGRASSEEILDGAVFGIAVISLLYPIVLLVAVSGLSATGRFVRVLVSTTAPFFAMLFVSLAASDSAFAEVVSLNPGAKEGDTCRFPPFYSQATRGTLIFPLGVAALCILIWLIPSRWMHRMERYSSPARSALPLLSFAAVITASLTSAYISARGPRYKIEHVGVWVTLGIFALVLLLQALLFRLIGGGLSEAVKSEVSDSLSDSIDKLTTVLNSSKQSTLKTIIAWFFKD